MFSRAIYTLTSTGRFSQVGPTVRLLLRDRSNSLPRTYCTLGLLLRLTALRTYCDVGLTTTATLSSFIVGLPPPSSNQNLAGYVIQVSEALKLASRIFKGFEDVGMSPTSAPPVRINPV
jgi:hypothetical protein